MPRAYPRHACRWDTATRGHGAGNGRRRAIDADIRLRHARRTTDPLTRAARWAAASVSRPAERWLFLKRIPAWLSSLARAETGARSRTGILQTDTDLAPPSPYHRDDARQGSRPAGRRGRPRPGRRGRPHPAGRTGRPRQAGRRGGPRPPALPAALADRPPFSPGGAAAAGGRPHRASRGRDALGRPSPAAGNDRPDPLPRP
jgi:hypothetical protein